MIHSMKLSKEASDELHVILKKDYGVSVSEEEVQKLGVSLLRLTKISLRPHLTKVADTETEQFSK